MKINIIIGTNRPESLSFQLAELVKTLYTHAHSKPILTDLKDLPAEIFSPQAYQKKPLSFKPFVENMLRAAGLVFIVPEYNGTYSGALKYFIDMLPFPQSFKDKPVCFIGLASGEWGGLRAVEQLQQIVTYRRGILFPERVFIPRIKKRVALGKEETERLKSQTEGFCQFVRKLH